MHRDQISLHHKCKLTVRDVPLLGSSPTHVTFTLRAATCIFFPLPVWLGAVILHFFYTALTYMEIVHADAVCTAPKCCVPGSCCLHVPKERREPVFHRGSMNSGKRTGQRRPGMQPILQWESVLFLLRGSVGSHSADPRRGRSNERRLLSGHISCNFSTSWVADMLYLY